MAIMAMPCLQTPLVLVGNESMGKKMLGVLLPIAAGVKQIEGFLLLLMETNTATEKMEVLVSLGMGSCPLIS